MAPRADNVCLGIKCKTPDGEASVYELPVGSTACPVCRSRRIQRLYNAVNVLTRPAPQDFDTRLTSSSMARRVDAIAEEPMRESERKAREMREIAARRYPMVRAVPMRGLPQALHEVYGQANGAVGVDSRALTAKATLGGSLNPTIGAIQQEPMRPTPIARDREFKIVQGPNGPEVDK